MRGQLSLPEPAALMDRVPAGKVETSVEAFEGTSRSADQARVLDYVTNRREGATCDEVCAGLGMLVQTVSARLNDLARAGLIRRDGTRRPTRTGATAYVWRAVAERREAS